MNQTEECVTKRVFDVMISYDNFVGKWLLDFLADLAGFLSSCRFILYFAFVLSQELTVFPYRLQVYCTSMGLLWWVRFLSLF